MKAYETTASAKLGSSAKEDKKHNETSQCYGYAARTTYPTSFTPSTPYAAAGGNVDPAVVQRVSFEKWVAGENQEVSTFRGLPGLVSDVPINPELQPDQFILTIKVKVGDLNYLYNSMVFMIKKYGRRFLNTVTQGYVQKFFGPSPSGMGHTWINLLSKQGEKVVASYSLGFYPGRIANPDPDDQFTEGDQKKYIYKAVNFAIGAKEWENALREVYRWKTEVEPPEGGTPAILFDLHASNCTSFARAVAEAADVPFPSMKIPTFSSNEGFTWVDNPNTLLSALEESSYAYDPSLSSSKEGHTKQEYREDLETKRLLDYIRVHGSPLTSAS